jgi:hypothetical protein
VVWFRRNVALKRKLPAGVQAKLARAALRAARTAAENDRCGVAELLFGFGGGDLGAASARARSKGAVLKVFDAGMEGADAAKAIIECRQRDRAKGSTGATT